MRRKQTVKFPLGRLIEFDERSRLFNIGALFRPDRGQPITKVWDCAVHLDQGKVGACTGFSVSYEAAAEPVAVPGITNEVALSLYHDAQKLDDYPDDEEGSSVLAAMKAAKLRGWYDEYRWAFSEPDLALAVSHHGPAVLGIPWYSGMMQPDSNGVIHPTGTMEGGHAICARGHLMRGPRWGRRYYRLRNSWGKSWGLDGDCLIAAADLAVLLKQQGEACIPVKRNMPTML